MGTPWKDLPKKVKARHPVRQGLRGHRQVPQPLGARALLLDRLRRRGPLHSMRKPRRNRFAVHVANSYESYMRESAVPGRATDARLKPEVLAVHCRTDKSIADAVRHVRRTRARLDQRPETRQASARSIAGEVLKEIEARLGFLERRRPRLPDALARGRHPVRRRGAAHPTGHADRLRPGRRHVRARRAVHRPAPA